MVAKRYGAFSPLGSVHVNGQLTTGGSITNFAGLTVVYGAPRKQLRQRHSSGPRSRFDGLTPEQRYFLSWA